MFTVHFRQVIKIILNVTRIKKMQIAHGKVLLILIVSIPSYIFFAWFNMYDHEDGLLDLTQSTSLLSILSKAGSGKATFALASRIGQSDAHGEMQAQVYKLYLIAQKLGFDIADINLKELDRRLGVAESEKIEKEVELWAPISIPDQMTIAVLSNDLEVIDTILADELITFDNWPKLFNIYIPLAIENDATASLKSLLLWSMYLDRKEEEAFDLLKLAITADNPVSMDLVIISGADYLKSNNVGENIALQHAKQERSKLAMDYLGARIKNETKLVQDYLYELFYEPGPTDGIIGKGTKRAIKQWQRHNNYPQTGQLNIALIEHAKKGIQATEHGVIISHNKKFLGIKKGFFSRRQAVEITNQYCQSIGLSSCAARVFLECAAVKFDKQSKRLIHVQFERDKMMLQKKQKSCESCAELIECLI